LIKKVISLVFYNEFSIKGLNANKKLVVLTSSEMYFLA